MVYVICEVEKRVKEDKIVYFHKGKPLVEITDEEANKFIERQDEK